MKGEMLKRALKVLIDFIFSTLSVPLSLLTLNAWDWHSLLDIRYYLIIPASRIISLYYFGTFLSIWSFSGITDIIKVFLGVTFSSLLSFSAFWFSFGMSKFCLTFFFLEWVFAIVFLSGLRFFFRWYYEFKSGSQVKFSEKRRVLLVGASDLAESYIKYRKKHPEGEEIVGIADEREKLGLEIMGCPVLCTVDSIPEFVKSNSIDTVVFALPKGNEKKVEEIAREISKYRLALKTLPHHFSPETQSMVRDLEVTDLYFKEEITISQQEAEKYFRGKRVFITGAGGFIGSELSKQMVRFNPELIIFLDRGENSLFYLEESLKSIPTESKKEYLLLDLLHRKKIQHYLKMFKPHYIFHAASYKHVPVMERHPAEAFLNNVIGTYILLEEAKNNGVQKFLYISTDKAVNPAGVMGATKKIAEDVVSSFARDSFETLSVRFGNVMDSVGSVVPIFREQIKRGGPVTVTHPQAKRYFMSVEEAVMLVIQSFFMGKEGEIFVLDMGEPVSILELAEKMISLSGLVPHKDIKIEFTGLRPGEKLTESLFNPDEIKERTSHPRIFLARKMRTSKPPFLEILPSLAQKIYEISDEEVMNIIRPFIVNENNATNGFTKTLDKNS